MDPQDGNGAFGRMQILEFLLERLDHRCCREQTAVLRKAGEPDQCSVMFETRNSVADRSRRFRSPAQRIAFLSSFNMLRAGLGTPAK